MRHNTNRHELALRLLMGHLEEFRPNLTKQKEKIRAFGIKKELYRPFQECLSCLSLICKLKEKGTFSRIEELNRLQLISAEGAKNLKSALRQVLSLRFEAHLFYQDEREYLCFSEEEKPQDPNLLYTNESHIEALHAIYRVLLPFHKSMEEFSFTKEIRSLKDQTFYEESPSVQAEVFKKTLQYKKAQEAYQQAVALNPNNVKALSYLGDMNYLLGNPQEALERAQLALKISLTCGAGHPNVATSYSHIGQAHASLGKYQEALEYHQKALKIRKDTYGDEHPDVATSYSNIGRACASLGKYRKALKFHQQALNIFINTYGHEPDVATSCSNIGQAYASLGKYKEALDYHQKALNIRDKTYGDKHPDIAISYSYIGGVYASLGEYKNALKYYQKALNIRKMTYGDEHPDVATDRSYIGRVYDSLGKYRKALKSHQKALKIRIDTYGDEHLDVATSYSQYWSGSCFFREIQRGAWITIRKP